MKTQTLKAKTLTIATGLTALVLLFVPLATGQGPAPDPPSAMANPYTLLALIAVHPAAGVTRRGS